MGSRENPDKRQPVKSAGPSARGETGKISEKESADIDEMSSPRTPVIYESVRRLGDEEMERPLTSLWWSGVAAGLSISFSLFAQAVLQTHLPDASWRPLIVAFGYSAGFVMAILSRQQLFTENTITAVLPVMNHFTASNAWRLSRTWAVVLAANMAGTFVAAAFCSFTPVLEPPIKAGMIEIAQQIMGHSWTEMVFRSVASGFLMATMVWLLPSAEAARLQVIVLITYLIAVGGFMHIVAGSMEAFLLALNGILDFRSLLTEFFVPVLIGNIIGGTVLFAMIAYAQVMNEI